MNAPRRMVIALGGNAIQRPGQRGTVEEQIANIRGSLDGIVAALAAGWSVVLTHGNGPQVGQMLLMVEAARGQVPELPLGICVADTEGALGYLIQQALVNRLRQERRPMAVITVITQVVVNKNDPAFARPTKPVGAFLGREEAESFSRERGWTIAEDAGRGLRRVVPSPHPLAIVEGETIRRLLDAGIVVIAAGGGGVPVIEEPDGTLRGVDAVIDKDLASAILARSIGAQRLVMLTGEPFVFLDYGKATQRPLVGLSVAEARRYLEAGQFPPGSMGPKIEAAVDFLAGGGEEVLITSIEAFTDALEGKAGTRIREEQPMLVYHAAITAAADYLERRAPHRQAHLERITALRAQGFVIGGGPAPDGQTADIFYRVSQPSDVARLIEEDPYYVGKVWTAYALRTFLQFIEPWELPPVVTDGSRRVTLVEGVAEETDMATFALIELRGAGRLAFGGFFEGGTTLALMKTPESAAALGWLAETGFWKANTLTARPLLHVL
ncbi:MAG: carbamate kinase [Candidatus Rokubacteria bacterium]|nr:carbamate kinase [Candidatus Rokubacteria bacterium]